MSAAAPLDWLRTHKAWGVLDPQSEREGFGQCLWNAEAPKQGQSHTFKALPHSGADTAVKILEETTKLHGARRAVGWRDVVKVHEVEENGAKREKIEFKNEYQWLTYAEYYERVLNLARGFSLIGLVAQAKIVIYADTQRDWLVSAFAAWHSNAQVVTIYATLGEEGALHGINETGATVVVVDARLLKVLAKILPQCKSVKNIVTMTPCDPVKGTQIRNVGVGVHCVDELVLSGKTWSYSPAMPKSEDTAVIMYTSGTTAAPKGVVISHGNIAAVVCGVEHSLQGLITCEDTYLCYLPLAHIMEMAAEICFMSMGVALGFGSPHTLTDSAVKLKRPESMGDAPCLNPTFMVFAPAILDKVYQSVQARREQLGPLGRKIFGWGLNSGQRHFDRGKVGANRIYNGIVFKKVQRLLGGSLKAIITGSATLAPEIQIFIQTVLDVPVRQGYGLTETCAGSCVGFWGDNALSNVGPPTVSACTRLADWAEGNYLNSDKDKPEIRMRRGEVLIGGPAVSSGYFLGPHAPAELAKKNEEDWVVVDGVRFFRTGDIAQLRENGTMQIIDRKKDLWKGPNGEYVALAKVEASLKLCEYVDLPMCYAKTGGAFPVALLCPQRARLLALGAELGIAAADFEALCREPRVVEKVAEACNAQCKEQRLADFEIPKKYALVAELWTAENDLLTAAMKMKRPAIASKHKDLIEAMYA